MAGNHPGEGCGTYAGGVGHDTGRARGATPAGPRPRRGAGPLVSIAAALAIVAGVLALSLLPLPAYTVQPGLLLSLAEDLQVDGRRASRVLQGDYAVATVAVADADVGDLVRSWVSADLTVVPRTSLFDPGQDEEAFVAQQREVFRGSAQDAAAAVAALGEGGAPEVAVLDVVVGGPSAGLLLALAILDVGSEVDLAAGRVVSGTGTMGPDGEVGVVGSVDLKVRAALLHGAQVFVVHPDQAVEARRVADGRLEVVEAATLAEAVAGLGGR